MNEKKNGNEWRKKQKLPVDCPKIVNNLESVESNKPKFWKKWNN